MTAQKCRLQPCPNRFRTGKILIAHNRQRSSSFRLRNSTCLKQSQGKCCFLRNIHFAHCYGYIFPRNVHSFWQSIQRLLCYGTAGTSGYIQIVHRAFVHFQKRWRRQVLDSFRPGINLSFPDQQWKFLLFLRQAISFNRFRIGIPGVLKSQIIKRTLIFRS